MGLCRCDLIMGLDRDLSRWALSVVKRILTGKRQREIDAHRRGGGRWTK